MKIAVACGGTGGHVLPGLVTAEVLAGRGHEVVLWMGGRDVEASSVEGWGGAVVRIRSAGFPAGFSLKAVSTGGRLLGACIQSTRAMRRSRPDVLLAMGSYSSVGPVVAARLLRVPVVLHEANAVPGRAIALLCRFARVVAVTFETARRHFPSIPIVLTGLPVRPGLSAGKPFADLDPHRFTLLVMGGSQGARALNELVPKALVELKRKGRDLQVIHLSGRADEQAVRAVYDVAGIENHVHGYLADMGRAYASADLAICRAGANTLTELALCGLPALLVPLPQASRGHQEANARELEAIGGADVVLQKELDPARLVGYIVDVMADRVKRDGMRAALSGFADEAAADKLADLVENVSCPVPAGRPSEIRISNSETAPRTIKE